MISKNYLDYILNPLHILGTKKRVKVNPTISHERIEPDETKIFLYEFDKGGCISTPVKTVSETFDHLASPGITWINVEGLRKVDVEQICAHFGIHPLIVEDILSIGQRPKMDELNGIVFCLLNMLYYDNNTGIETEQVSIVLGKNFVITFQEDASKDVFNMLREKLKLDTSKVRQSGSDFLFYTLIDSIVDHYYIVMEEMGDNMELLEEDIIRNANTRSLAKINLLRKEMIILKRSVTPVRDIVSGILRSESELIDEKTEKYFKDVYDHIIQAGDMAENYRDMMMNLQDLYLNNVNLKTNEAMKVMAIVTCLMAPATVIGGIFGMNFDVIPFSHQVWGFSLAIFFMLITPIVMLVIFKKRGWFKF
jgi:magnesium transporter